MERKYTARTIDSEYYIVVCVLIESLNQKV